MRLYLAEHTPNAVRGSLTSRQILEGRRCPVEDSPDIPITYSNTAIRHLNLHRLVAQKCALFPPLLQALGWRKHTERHRTVARVLDPIVLPDLYAVKNGEGKARGHHHSCNRNI